MNRNLRELVIIGGLLIVVLFVGGLEIRPADPSATTTPGQVAVALGALLLVAHLFGRVLQSIELPLITGYLLAGVLLGPYALGVVGLPVKESLGMINSVALGLIALTAGGELSIGLLRARIGGVAWITLFHSVGIFGATFLVFLALGRFSPQAALGLGGAELVAAGLLLGLIATATSPSSTVAVINEVQASGPVATVSLGVTVLKDVAVIVLMALTLTAVSGVLGRSGEEIPSMLWILEEIAASIALGAGVGALLIFYLRRVGKEEALVLLGTVFVVVALSDAIEEAYHFHLHFLLMCIAAGFVVQNASRSGRRFIRGVERSSLPVYIIFFTLSGVGLDLGALVELWPVALGFVLWRIAAVWAATAAGARLGREVDAVRRHAWTGFVAQAGISLGLAEIAASSYPGFGDRVKTLVLASVAINQVIGPVLFKWALTRVGEAGSAHD
jgi:Kef-type K+ transport system membrane component KefB